MRTFITWLALALYCCVVVAAASYYFFGFWASLFITMGCVLSVVITGSMRITAKRNDERCDKDRGR